MTTSTGEDPWAWAREDDAGPRPSTAPVQDWGWAHEEPEPLPRRENPEQVLAVLVVHQAADWLDRTLRALEGLTEQPGRLVAVDTGSADASRQMLADARARGVLDEVVEAGPQPGFGAAVAHVLSGRPGDFDWLWLLHDDLEPQPDALRELLMRASADDHPDLLFPKLLQPHRRNHPDQLAEVGSSVTAGGSRFLGLAPGEIDQRQLDSRPVLGGSTAGMLVCRTVWDDLGGLDPALPLFRDGQDFGWRANSSGALVVTAPDAALHHRQEGRFGDRDSDLIQEPAMTDRLLGMRMMAAHAADPRRELARQRRLALQRSAGYLLGKAPAEARAEFHAARQAGRQRDEVDRMLARSGPAAATLAPGLRPAAREVWASRRDRVARAASDSWRERRGDDPETSLDDLIGDDFAGGRTRRRLATPGRVLMMVLLVATFSSARHLFGRGRLSSVALAPAPHDLASAWAAWLQPTPGEWGANAGWLGLMALGSTLAGGQPEVFVRLLVVAAPLLGGLLAHRGLRRVLGDGWLAAALALAWPASAVLLGVTARGSVSGAMATILLPVAAGLAVRWFRQEDDVADPWRVPAALALALGFLALGSPLFAMAGLVIGAARAVTRRRFHAPGLAVALGPWLLLLPWIPRLVQHPGRLLTGTDPTVARGDAGAMPLWMGACLAVLMMLLAVLGVIQGRPRLHRTASTGLVVGVAASAVIGAWLPKLLVPVDGQSVHPSGEPWQLTAVACVLVLVSLALNRKRTSPIVPRAHLAAVLLSLLIAVLGFGVAMVGASRSPLQVRQTAVPEFVTAVQQSSRASRALLIAMDAGTHRWALTSAQRPAWGSGEAHPVLASPERSDQVAALAAQFAQGTPSDDLAARLARLGIAHVVMTGGEVRGQAALSNAPGLHSSTSEQGTTVWTVQGLTSRLALDEAAGTFRLAETPDGRWVVRVGGDRVPVQADASGFGLHGSTGGKSGAVTWRMATPWWQVPAQLLGVVVLAVLTAPSVQRQGARPPARLATPRRAS